MTHRRIDISGMTAIDTPVSGTPELRFVPITALIIDDRYQRAIERRGQKNIERIAANFDWAKFSPLMVSRREVGTFAIIDGQHRAHAAALCGITDVPAVVSTLTPEQEAAAFSWINGSVTALTGNQIFKAALAAFEPWAVQADAVVTSAGCRLMTYNRSASEKKSGEVYCIGLIRKTVEAGNSGHLRTVLQGVMASNLRDDVRYVAAYGLGALLPSIIAAGVTNPRVVTDFLNAHDLEKVARGVRRLREDPRHKGTSFKVLFASSITALLNEYARSSGAPAS